MEQVTRDAFLSGRLRLTQPAVGHRSGTDAILLAAAVPADFSGLALDAGAGVGLVGLAVASSHPRARVILLERDGGAARLADENAAANGLADRVEVRQLDLLSRSGRASMLPVAADLVVTNPPFHEASRVRVSPDAARRGAHVLPAGTCLADWIAACLACLTAKGELILIAPAAALAEILDALRGRTGGVRVKGLHPHLGAPAHRVLVWARKGSRAPLVLAAPLVLHDGRSFTSEVEAIHRGAACITW